MQIPKLIVVLALIAFFLVGTFGMGYSMMMSSGDMSMVGCPLMGHDSALCNMNPLDHLSMWQTMFAAVPVPSLILSLLLLLAAFVFLRFRQFLWLLHPSPQPVRVFYDPEINSHDPLRRFIARGLMHPKIF